MSCNYFVIRKKRNCRMGALHGQSFCAEHQPLKSTDEDKNALRIVCPLDPKHTCYAHKLRRHLKICNSRPKDDLPPFIVKNINSGRDNPQADEFKQLASFTSEELAALIVKVNEIFVNCKLSVTEKFSTHELLESELKKPDCGDKARKHLVQTSSILGLLKEYGLMQAKTCFIEFGAGRGLLSFWLASAAEQDDCLLLLVERASPKHKRDNKLDKTKEKVKRIKADIADLVLDEVESVSSAQHVVGVTKHLCGAATDLALRCLANAATNKAKINGCVMTFCCHHRCRWGSYVGKAFFAEMGLTEGDFGIMCGMSSWATCGTGFSRERQQEEAPPADEQEAAGLTREEKEQVGEKCKMILNLGRAHFLESGGFECHLHYYAEKSITLENVCIVATRVNKTKD